MSEVFASGSWHVKQGSEGAFVEAWNDLLRSTVGNRLAFIEANLLRDQKDPRHFVSFAKWGDEAARADWKGSAEFAEGHAACRALCDDFYGSDYDRASRIEGASAGVRA